MADTDIGVSPPAPPPETFPHFRYANQTLNAVSFGFIATAVLFAMFLVMAIFERILRPHRAARAAARDEERAESIPESSTDSQKPGLYHSNSYSKAVSVLMPGEEYPTYFALPTPPPCPPECIVWPPHDIPLELSDKENLHDVEKGRGKAVVAAPCPFSTEVIQDVVKGRGESSSRPPEEEYSQDLEAQAEASSSTCLGGRGPVQDSSRH